MFDKSKKAYYLAYNSAPGDKENLEAIADHFRDDVKDYKTELYFRILLVNRTPNDESSLMLLGNCHYALDQNDQAYLRYKEASHTSDSPGTWVYGNLGNLYHRVGLYTLCIETLQQALKIEPDDRYSHERIGTAIAASNKLLSQTDQIIDKVKNEIISLDLSLDDAEPNNSQSS